MNKKSVGLLKASITSSEKLYLNIEVCGIGFKAVDTKSAARHQKSLLKIVKYQFWIPRLYTVLCNVYLPHKTSLSSNASVFSWK